MGLRKLIIAASILAVGLSVMTKPDFEKAERLINEKKPNIDYNMFCSEQKRGRFKMACRVKEVPSVGFFLCQQPDFCNASISLELNALKMVADAKIKTVDFQQSVIYGVKCANTGDVTCAGFLEAWVSASEGWFEHLANIFLARTVESLIQRIKSRQKSSVWSNTAGDMVAIKDFMTSPKNDNEYKQICDLQGFFMTAGGFLVSDPSGIEERPANSSCYDDKNEPTSQQVLDGLQQIIDALSEKSSGPPFGSTWFF